MRSQTSPDDVHGMARSVGILTSTGGLACHAAVVARGWDIPAVVGASDVVVGDGIVTIAGRSYPQGAVLSIDGSSGEVFGGAVESVRTVSPEAAMLLEWARELGIEIGTDKEQSAMPETASGTTGGAGVIREDVIRALHIKGYVLPGMLAPALGVTTDEAAELLDRLTADGIVKESGGMFSLSDDGKALAAEMLAADRESWGPANAAAASGWLPCPRRAHEDDRHRLADEGGRWAAGPQRPR